MNVAEGSIDNLEMFYALEMTHLNEDPIRTPRDIVGLAPLDIFCEIKSKNMGGIKRLDGWKIARRWPNERRNHRNRPRTA